MRQSTERALRWFLQKKLAEEKFRLDNPHQRHMTEKFREPTDDELAYYRTSVNELLASLEED